MITPLLMTIALGSQIAQMIPAIAQFRIESFKEYPYLYAGTLEREYEYLELYKNNKHALAIYRIESKQEVVVIGAPLVAVFPEVKPIFESAQLDANSFYFMEEATFTIEDDRLLSEMVAMVETKIKKWGYENLRLLTIREEENHPLKPVNYQSIELLLEKIGFVQTTLAIPTSYATICDDDVVEQREHEFIFWTKKV